jgi:hypothetical protein
MIYRRTEFRMPSSSASSVINVKLKAKHSHRVVIFQANNILVTIPAYFQSSVITHRYRNPQLVTIEAFSPQMLAHPPHY